LATIQWYFDFISPYAYLQSARLDALAEDRDIEPVPVLFAGLLNHWGQKGPAEVAPKKVFTFRQCLWRARRDGIPFRAPPMHPFNPLRALRLSIALGNDLAAVRAIFRAIWVDGHLPDDPDGWAAMQAALGISDGDSRVSDPAVKAELANNGEAAVAAGVFGVPTCRVGAELFWGDDCLEMVRDYLDDPGMFENEEMRRIHGLKASAERR
jgi:2-hydroxychromene-2-carboxylate isomerase